MEREMLFVHCIFNATKFDLWNKLQPRLCKIIIFIISNYLHPAKNFEGQS